MGLEPSASLGADPSACAAQSQTAASFEVVILAGGHCPRLHPLTTTEKPKALLPLVNAPLLSYPLRAAAEAGVRRATVAAIGEQAAARIRAYLASPERPASTVGVECEVVTVPGDAGTAGALRAVAPRLLERAQAAAAAAATAGGRGPSPSSSSSASPSSSSSSSSTTVLVYPADLVTDVPLRAFAAAHAAGGDTGTAAAAVGAGRAVATVLLGRRRTSPSAETKPGRPPRNVDYLGLDAARQSLLFAAPSPEALREIRLPLATLAVGGGAGGGGILGAGGALELRSDLVDLHLYAFDVATVLPLLLAGPGGGGGAAGGGGGGGGAGAGSAPAAAAAAAAAAASSSSFLSLKLDFLPYLARMASSGRLAAAVERAQQRLGGGAGGAGASAAAAAGGGASAAAAAAGAAAAAPAADGGSAAADPPLLPLGGGGGGEADSPFPYAAMCHSYTGPAVGGYGQQQQQQAGAAAGATPAPPPSAPAPRPPLRVAVHFVPDACYAARVNTVAAYCDASRDLAAPDGALALTGLSAGRHGNVVPADAALGAKATIGPACVVGPGCSLGDRASVKRSVVGSNVSVGPGAKVVNSILLDGASVGAGASVHGCVLACGASAGAGSALKDCQVAAGVAVPAEAEHTGEILGGGA